MISIFTKIHMRSLFFTLLLICFSWIAKAQSYHLTQGTLDVTLNAYNPCGGSDNGYLEFIVNSTDGTSAVLIITPISGGVVPVQILSAGQSYIWNPSHTLAAGSFNYIIQDGSSSINTFTSNTPVVISNISSPTLTKVTETNNTSCVTPNGQVVASISGGSMALPAGGSYTYTWTSDNAMAGLPTNVVTNGTTPLDLAAEMGIGGLRAGTYTLHVQDNYSQCDATVSFTIADPSPIAYSITNTSPIQICEGNPFTISFSGSEVGVTYTVYVNGSPIAHTFNGNGSPVNVSLNASDFSDGDLLSILATNGFCTPVMSNSVVLSKPTAISVNSINHTDLTCFGVNTGSIAVTASGGIGTLSYTLLPNNISNTSGNFNGLAAGIYTVSIADASGCPNTSTGNITITQPPALVISSTLATNITCSGNSDGSITVLASGGTGDLTYVLLPLNLSNNTGVFNNLAAGTYRVRVTDATGCGPEETADLIIADPNPITIASANSIHPTCFEATNGSITIVGAGGTSPLTYTINPLNVTNATGAFNGLSAGTYTITIKDQNNCSLTSDPIELIEPEKLEISNIQASNILCYGDATGTVTVTATGGTLPLTYIISPGGATNTTGVFTGLTAGSYTVSVNDANNCGTVLSNSVVITEPPQLVLGTFTSTDATCDGVADGTITITASGGTGDHLFTLSPLGISNTSGIFTGLASGNYTIVVSDENSCSTLPSTPITITAPNAIVFGAPTTTNITCFNGNDGSITISASGGVGQLQYTLNGVTNNSGVFTGLIAGSYIVEVTDANTCGPVYSSPITLTQPNQLVITSTTFTDATCASGNDGSITVVATGGTGTLTYTIASGGTSNSTGIFTGLGAGSYTVSVTDAAGCPNVNSLPITISSPAALSLGAPTITDVTCFGGANGGITIVGTGGTGTLTYTISPGGTSNTNGIFTGLAAGSYTISVTDANGCTPAVLSGITISQPATIALGAPTKEDVTCHNGTDGVVRISATGGTGTLTFTLLPNNISNSTGEFTGLTAGTYTVEVTDANNCGPIQSTSITISQPNAIVFGAPTTTNVTCFSGNDGSITISATGGTGTLQYTLNGTTNTTGIFNGLTAGTYIIEVTDANNCGPINANPITLTEPSAISITSSTFTNASCAGGNDGSITVVAAGGTGTLTYTIAPGAISNSTGVFTSLSAGTYTITVTDAANCTPESTTITISTPTGLSLETPTVLDATCFGVNDGSITIVANGGTGTLTYSISPGGTSNTTGIFNNLGAGSYTISVTDANGCAPAVSNPITISQPASISVTNIQTVHVTCFNAADGAIEIEAAGGTGALSYTLLPNNISNATGEFTGLTAGSYTVSVTDENNCTPVVTSTITINSPANITITNVTAVDATCQGATDGSVNVTATGGTGTLQYTLNGVTNNTGIFNGLAAGTYTVSVTDANNCGPVESTNIIISEPAGITITSVASTLVSCNQGTDGTITVVGSGSGALEYTLLPTGTVNATGVFTGLAAGTYTVTITEVAGCATISSSNIVINEPPAYVLVQSIVEDATCAGVSDGAIRVEVTGGSGPLTYTLTSSGASNTTGEFTNLVAGTYAISVSDGTACAPFLIDNLIIGEPSSITITAATPVSISCQGLVDGSITVVASGGSGPLTYTLQPANVANATGVFTGLAAGTYTIEVTDGSTCAPATTSVIIQEPSNISITSITAQDALCAGGGDAQILVVATGGTGTLTYTLLPNNLSNTTGDFQNLLAGVYTISVTDQNNCTPVVSSTIEIKEPNAGVSYGGQICNTESSVDLFAGLGGADSNGIWINLDGAPVTINNGVIDFTGVAAGFYRFEYIVGGNGVCAGASSIVSIDVVEAPSAGNSVTVAVCSSNNAFDLFAALGNPDAGGTWTDLDASGAVLSGSIADFTGIADGIYRFSYTLLGSVPCGNDTAIVTVNVISTTPNAGSNTTVEVCNDETNFNLFAALNGNPDAGGVWTDLSASGGVISGNNIDLSNVPAGIYAFEYRLNVVGCGDAASVLTVEVSPKANAGSDGSITQCVDQLGVDLFAALQDNPDTNGVWVDEDTSGAVLSGNIADFTGVAAGIYHFRYVVAGVGPCGDASSVVTVTIENASHAGPDVTVHVCEGETAFDLLAALNGATAGGTWTDVSGSGAVITGNLIDLSALAIGSYVFEYEVGSATCGIETTQLTIEIEQAPNAGVDGSLVVCNSETTIDLLAVIGAQTGGVWSDLDNSNVVFNGDQIDITGLASGTYRFEYTISNGVCADAKSIATITIQEQVNAGIGQPLTVCNTDTAFDLNTTLTDSPNVGGTWYDVTGGGIGAINNILDLTALTVGQYQFEYIVLATAPCLNDTARVTIDLINTVPSAGTATTIAICNNEDALDLFSQLAGSPNVGGTWTDLDNTGLAIVNNKIDVTSLSAGSYRFEYTLSVPNCGTSSAILTVDITERANAGGDVTIAACTQDSAVDLFASITGNPDGTGSWTDLDGSGVIFNGNVIDVTTLATGSYRYQYLVQGVLPCLNDTSVVTVEIFDQPFAGISDEITVCASTTSVDFLAAIGGAAQLTGQWIDVDTSGVVITNHIADFSGVAPGTYTFIYKINAVGTCDADSATLVIHYEAIPDAGEDTTLAVCNNVDPIDLLASLQGTPQAGGTWTDVDTSGVTITGNVLDPSTLTSGNYRFRYIIEGTACDSDTATVTLQISDGPSAAVAGPDQILCGNVLTTTLQATPPTAGIGTWVVANDPSGLVVNPTSPTSMFIGAVGRSYTLRWIVLNGTCQPSIDTVVINFAARPEVSSPVTVCLNNTPPALTAQAVGAVSYNWFIVDNGIPTFLANTTTNTYTPGNELDVTQVGSTIYAVTAVYPCGESPVSQIVVNVSNSGTCGNGGGGTPGTGECATVVIKPNPTPASCTLSTGSVVFTVNPFVPLVNVHGVIIKIDGVSNTNLNITRTHYNDTTFLNLPMGTYTYSIVYGDSTCIKNGTFNIDQSGTVGTPFAFDVVNPICAGDSTGAVTIDVPGETGNLLEWSLDGITWKTFTSGNQITGIPAGPAPSFERVISVRRDATDPCYAAVRIQIKDVYEPLKAQFEVVPTTCNDETGGVKNLTAVGGAGGPYHFAVVNETTLNALSAGDYVLRITDQTSGCVRDTTFTVTFPGFVDLDITSIDASCDNNGLSGGISIQFNKPGVYQIGITQNQLEEPEEYITYASSGPLDLPLNIEHLARGNYFVYAKTSSSECVTRRGPIEVNGFYAIDFSLEPYCIDNKVSLAIMDVKGQPNGIPFTVQVIQALNGVEVYNESFFLNQGANSLPPLVYDNLAFLQLPGEYIVKVSQVQSDGVMICAMSSPEYSFVVTAPVSATIAETVKSYPDIQNGKILVSNFMGGSVPYDISIQLTTPAVAGQVFSTDWEEVLKNSDLRYEKRYAYLPAGEYQVYVRDQNNCVVQLDALVPLDTDIYVPNIFTPNGDGKNDVFFVRNLPEGSKLVITNRWGKQVYSSDNYKNNWDGKDVSDGVYYYRLKAEGSSVISGWVEVLRGQEP
jgi:gliding motility-associated-like protein